MNESSEEYYEIVREELKIFILKYQKNPFDFLTEYDLQSYLYTKIFDRFDNKGIKVEIATSGENEPITRWKKNESTKIKINPVKTEYPAGYRFDIAVIDDEGLEPKDSAYWHQKLKIGIEIKYHRCSFNRIPAEIRKFKLDIDKLKRYKLEENPKNFRGLSILFIQNENEEREKEFENNRFKENYIQTDLNSIISTCGIEGLVVTGSNCYQWINIEDS